MAHIVAQMMPGRSDHAAGLMAATQLYWTSLPEAPKNWRQINPNLNEYHSNTMEISNTFWIPDITDWLRQHQEKQRK
jgi:hypothetical protein